MSNRRWFYYAISLAGLLLGVWGAVGAREQAQIPPEFPADALKYPVRLEDVEVASPAQLHFQGQGYPLGSSVEIVSGETIHPVALARELSLVPFLLELLSGFFFLTVNLLVFAPRMSAPAAGPRAAPLAGAAGGDAARVPYRAIRDFYWATLLFGIAILIGGPRVPAEGLWPGALRPLIWIACVALMPVFFVHVALIFPRRQPLVERAPRLVPALALAAVGIMAWEWVVFLRYFMDPGPAAWAAIALPRTLSEVFLAVLVASGWLLLFFGRRRLELTREREQTNWLLWGFALGVTPYVFLRSLLRAFGIESPVDRTVDRVFEMCIPIAFTLAVVRYKFLDIDIIIRRSVLYTALAAVLAGVYLALAWAAGHSLGAALPAASPWVPALAASVAVALFRPTRRAVGAWVDHTFFKIRYDYAQALAELRADLPRASSQGELAQALRAFLEQRLQPKQTAVIVPTPEGLQAAAPPGLPPAEELSARAETAAGGLGRPRALPNSTSLPELERADFPAELAAAGFQLVAPLTAEGNALGWVLLGEKRSERRYVREDLELLEGAAAEAGPVLERIRLVQRVAEEASERRRLDELDRLKSDFLSRVAHDLRTPITSIRWSAQNLLDGVPVPPAPRQREGLEAIKTSTGQLNRLVTNLLEISRLELGAHAVELAPVDVAEVLRETLVSLRPQASARGLRLELQAGGEGAAAAPAVPPARASREKLYEVAANLVENAIKYSPPGAAVEITVEPAGPGRQRFVVRDHGPGVPEEDRERVFERFRQGRPSPYASQGGFGLGLYVVRSFMELMHGTVSAGNHPGGGAQFTCTLSDWAPREG